MHSREAYGYDSSYVIQRTKRNCQECTAMSGNFSYVLRRFNNHKLEEIIDKFTKHWNENIEMLLPKLLYADQQILIMRQKSSCFFMSNNLSRRAN